MSIVCPTITATDSLVYNRQIRLLQSFTKRLHIDLMDGEFAPSKSPELTNIWWPHEDVVDIHLMYQRPMDYIKELIHLKPNLVIIHNEADVHHMHFAAQLHKAGIKAGLAILQDTPVEWAYQIMHSFDHVLIFSGHLGYHGGKADLNLLDKVRTVRQLHPEAEIGWDGGVSDKNVRALIEAGVDVLNVGGFIANSSDPSAAYAKLEALTQ